MRGKLLLLAMACGAVSTAFAGGDGKNELLRKSGIKTNTNISYPVPYDPNDNPRTQPAVSAGYYLVDSDDPSGGFWRPDPVRKQGNLAAFTDTLVNPSQWKTVVTGPNQFPATFWDDNAEGRAYLRNPALATDSTDDAFAGPIPFNFATGFYFNGKRYDSVYISTNGLIALSNRRYFYDPTTRERTIPQGATTAYDPNSDDTRGPSGATLTGIDDPTPDNFGYQFIALGTGGSGTGTAQQGIRARDNVSFHGITALPGLPSMNTNSPLIAPLWDDMQMSVYNKYTNQVDNHSKIRYYRDVDNGIFIVYFVNLIPRRVKGMPNGSSATFQADPRPEFADLVQDPYISANIQVIFNEKDGSITYVYEKLVGNAKGNSFTAYPARTIFAYNATIGVRGPARHVNYVTRTQTTGAPVTYLQATEYLFGPSGTPTLRAVSSAKQDERVDETLNDFLAIRFKQFKNVLRVADIQYFVRPLSSSGGTDFTTQITNVNNFELLAGHDRLGAIQPDVLVQNLTNDIQGPATVNPGSANFTPQQLRFRARFKIFNQATGKVVYNSLVQVDSVSLANPTISGVRYVNRSRQNQTFPGTGASALNGIPPYGYAQIKFPAFETNQFLDDQIGRLKAVVIADPVSPEGNSLGDQWPFDDTTEVNLFNLRILTPTQTTAFNDDVREYHIIPLVGGAPMPSVTKWVNLEGEVVDGDEKTYNAPPPRGEYASNNIPAYKINSPVIKLNRYIIGDTEPATSPGGDKLISFPIDLRGRRGAVLSFSYQRTGRSSAFPRGWASAGLFGPEVRVLGDAPPAPFGANENWADKLQVEFAQPSADQINGIVNIADNRYNVHPRKTGNANTDNAAYTILGGGGYRRGFDEFNKDSVLTFAAGIRDNEYDAGKDQNFYKAFIPLPDTLINAPNEGAKWFRFRFNVRATKNSDTPLPQDDGDDFYVDNIRILFPQEIADIELSSIQVVWPYTVAPASQATQIPVRVRIANNTNVPAPSFGVLLAIQRGQETNSVYERTLTLPFLPSNREVEVPMPNWNARLGGPTTPMTGITVSQEYTLRGYLIIPGGDIEPLNDSTFTKFTLTFGTVFAYDPAGNASNNVPDFEGSRGRGLNLLAVIDQSTLGSVAAPPSPGSNPTLAFGPSGGSGSGQLAMRFTLYSQDTLRGFQAFFGELNQTDDKISFSVYRDQSGQPGFRIATLEGDNVRRGRGSIDEVKNGKLHQTPVHGVFGKYVNYMLDKELILQPGDYWVSVAQLGSVGFELGASASRMGMVATKLTTQPVPGVSSHYMLADPQLRVRRGSDLINGNFFAVENTRFSQDWAQLTPTTGNPVYPELRYDGLIQRGFSTVQTRSRGSFIPMIRPYLGARAYNSAPLAVELMEFEGQVRNKNVDLTWETASEVNNSGFKVERRVADNDANWEALEFVAAKGTGNSTVAQSYNYQDRAVTAGETYQYRLRQLDVSGKEQLSQVVELEIPSENVTALEQNSPNPVTGQTTTIKFSVAEKGNAKLEIMDLFGNTIRTLYDGAAKGAVELTWDGTNDAGSVVSNGSYLYRLTVGDRTETRKLTLTR